MKLWVIGISHHNCPVEIREKVNFSADEQAGFLNRVHSVADIAEALVLNTCNRLEFYIYCSNSFDAADYVTSVISAMRPDGAQSWHRSCYIHSGVAAVEHMFKVAGGLDSQIIGEGQILSQLKSAYAISIQCRTSKFMFHKLLHTAFHVGKAVREETRIDCGACSISVGAVRAAGELIDLKKARVMVIGAGENAQLGAKCLASLKAMEIVIVNRNVEAAQSVVERLGTGRAMSLLQLYSAVRNIDVIIASTGSAEPILRYEPLKAALEGSDRKLIIFDVAVPRDVEEQVGQLENVRLFNIDDINDLSGGDIHSHNHELAKADKIIQQHVKEFSKWLDTLNVVPIISELTQRLVQLARCEARRYSVPAQMETEKLELFAESLVKKILHGPITFIKNAGEEPDFEQLQAADLINKIFLEQGAEDQ